MPAVPASVRVGSTVIFGSYEQDNNTSNGAEPIEWLVMTVLVPEVMGGTVLMLLLVLGNILFVAYDLLVPRAEVLMGRITKLL